MLLRLRSAAPTDATQPASTARDERRQIAELVDEARGRHEWLPDGTMVGLWEIDPERDQVVRAARFARAAAEKLRSAIVLTTGFAERSGTRALGSVLDRAAQLLGKRADGIVLLDAASAEILRHRFTIETGSDVRLGPEIAFDEVVDRTPFVGRTRELDLVASLYDECAQDEVARAILVTGEAGSGKSRLLREVVRRCAPSRVWRARGDAMRPGSAYTLLSQMLRDALGIASNDVGETAADELRRGVEGMLGDTSTSAAEFLTHAAGFSSASPSAAMRSALADSAMMAARVRDAWEQLWAAVTKRGLHVLVLEDIHWADAPSLRLIESAVASVNGGLFVVAAARPEFHEVFPTLWKGSHVQEVRLTALSRKAAEALAAAIWRDGTEEQRRAAVNRAGGSPLWLEELLHHERTGATELPDSIAAVMQARLSKEPSDERRALRAAAIYGERAWLDGIAALMGVGHEEASRVVARLVAKDWLMPVAESRFESAAELRFRHALHRDATYATLTGDDARVGHALAADWLKVAGERNAITLAEHWERSNNPGNAIEYYVEAADAAHHANDLDMATARADRAISLGATGIALRRAQLLKGVALCWRGRVVEAAAVLRDAIGEVQTGDVRAPLLCGWAAMVGTMALDPALAMRAADLLVTVAPREAPPDEYAQALSLITSMLYFVGERARSDELVALVPMIEGEADERTRGWNAHSRLMYFRFSAGDTWAERGEALKSLDGFQSADDGAALTLAHSQLAIVELTLDERAEATLAAERGLQLAAQFDVPLPVGYCAPIAVLSAGDEAERRRRIDRALSVAEKLNDAVYGMYSRALLAYVLRLTRESAFAIDVLHDALEKPQVLSVGASLRMQLAGALVEADRAEEAAAECMRVVAMTQSRHLRGAFDLDFMATAVDAFSRVGQLEASRGVAARARKLIERRAARIDDAARRDAYLRSSFVERLNRLERESSPR